jgi:hypothetical protein
VSRPTRRPRIPEQVVAGRELTVLVDGPWARRWYWADDFAGMHQAARRYPAPEAGGGAADEAAQPITEHAGERLC